MKVVQVSHGYVAQNIHRVIISYLLFLLNFALERYFKVCLLGHSMLFFLYKSFATSIVGLIRLVNYLKFNFILYSFYKNDFDS